MSKIMELADEYAEASSKEEGESQRWDSNLRYVAELQLEKNEARAALAAEVEMLEADVDAKADIAHRALDERDALRAKLAVAQTANNLLDKALIAAHPQGSEGVVYEYWNEARKFMEATK